MSDKAKMVAVVVLGVLGVIWFLWYFSPYQQCVRAESERLYNIWFEFGDYPAEVREQAERRAKVNCIS